ncbi:MAG: hypothetical protein JXA68_07125 [Ignavibacteriales bacterium]|nr:hypothetical protein [Ignavibacteriales bacterium]
MNINTAKQNYYKPTPVKWRKIGDTIQEIALIGAGIVAVVASPPAWIPVAIAAIGRIGKIITNFSVE